MKLRLFLCQVLLSAVILGAPAAQAQVSYFLDQSNRNLVFPDGTNYLTVTISESGEDIRFDITILDPLLQNAGDNFGLQSFGFNLADGATMVDPHTNIVGLPHGWWARSNARQDGFGRFEVVSQGTAFSRVSPTLTFFIVGIAGDTPEDYVAFSDGFFAWQGKQLFAARVAGFDPYFPVKSAFFGGSTLVPLPPALLLFLAPFAAFLTWLRRSRKPARSRLSSLPQPSPAV